MFRYSLEITPLELLYVIGYYLIVPELVDWSWMTIIIVSVVPVLIHEVIMIVMISRELSKKERLEETKE